MCNYFILIINSYCNLNKINKILKINLLNLKNRLLWLKKINEIFNFLVILKNRLLWLEIFLFFLKHQKSCKK